MLLSRHAALIALLAIGWYQMPIPTSGVVPVNYVVDQQYDPATIGLSYNLIEQHPIGQEFMPEFSNIIAVHVRVQGTTQARIRLNIIQGNISGNVVATTARTLAVTDSGWFLFDLGAAATVIPDSTFVLQLVAEQGTGWTWAGNQQPIVDNPYHRGRIILLGTPRDNDDLHFITYGLAPTQTTTITIATNITLTSTLTNTVTTTETQNQTQTITRTATLIQTTTETVNRTQTITAATEALTTIITRETTILPITLLRTETSTTTSTRFLVTTTGTTVTSYVGETPGINTALLLAVAAMLVLVIWGQFLRARRVSQTIQR